MVDCSKKADECRYTDAEMVVPIFLLTDVEFFWPTTIASPFGTSSGVARLVRRWYVGENDQITLTLMGARNPPEPSSWAYLSCHIAQIVVVISVMHIFPEIAILRMCLRHVSGGRIRPDSYHYHQS